MTSSLLTKQLIGTSDRERLELADPKSSGEHFRIVDTLLNCDNSKRCPIDDKEFAI